MNDAKYVGLDVHQAAISATVLDSSDKLLMEAILETKAETVLQFLRMSCACTLRSIHSAPDLTYILDVPLGKTFGRARL